MPLTIKPSNIKYKNPSTGEYENINSVAEKSSAEMVADINAAGQIKINSINSTGNSYISQIQAKGTETLNSIPVDYTNLSNDVTDLKSAILLQEETIPDTTQTISFDSSGNVSSIVHKDGSNNTIRSDAFTFGVNTITEVRTLYTGETLTIVTNTTTLVTTVTYAAA